MAKIFLLKCLLRYIDNRLKNSQKKRCKEERYIFINRTKPNQKRSSQKKCTGVFRFFRVGGRPIDGQCLTIPSISAFWTLHIYAWFEPPADTSPNCKLDSSVELGCITEHFTVTQKLTCFVSCNPVVDVKWLFFIQVSQGGKALCTPSFSLKSCSISLIKAQETYQREMASQKHWGGQKHRVSGGNMKQSLASGRGFSDIQTYLVGFKQRSNVLQEPQQTTSIPSSNLWLCSSPWRQRWSLKEKSVREWMEAENESFWDRQEMDQDEVEGRWRGWLTQGALRTNLAPGFSRWPRLALLIQSCFAFQRSQNDQERTWSEHFVPAFWETPEPKKKGSCYKKSASAPAPEYRWGSVSRTWRFRKLVLKSKKVSLDKTEEASFRSLGGCFCVC